MKCRKFVVMILFIIQFFNIFSPNAYAQNSDINNATENFDTTVDSIVLYLKNNQKPWGGWENSDTYIFDITNIIETVNKCLNNKQLSSVSTLSETYLYDEIAYNNDDLSKYLLLNSFQYTTLVNSLMCSQNLDGGLGLDKGYTSDIMDTKLALKAFADLGETEAMTKAAVYIASQQNADGGFSYQQGLDSNAELTAEIADIFGDCIIKDQSLSYTLSDTISKLNEYLDANAVAISELSADNISEVYQHFHTALFKLKTTGKYNVTPYYDLQAKDGGVFDDPMATALFLELIVREQNTLTANIDHISVTNDKGYAVSSFNANENVNIDVVSEYETAKAYLKLSVETPSGNTIQLNSKNPVWNTGNSEEGTYTVKAEIVRSSNDETVVLMTQNFRIVHKLAIDDISLSLSKSYSRIGDKEPVSVYADIGLQNFSEENNNINVRWSVKDGNEVILSNNKDITEADLVAEKIHLGDFTPDTSEKKAYIITAEILSDDLLLVQTSTNYFVSDKGVAIVADVDKEYLYESTDNAEISVKLRDERVVDLILTTSSGNTELINKYADQIKEIKNKLEHQGYIVNLSSIETSYLTAQDTFAWTEYDHPNYDIQPPYTKHIIYEEDNIKMAGYRYVPYKDFLLVPDNNDSQKLFTFDIQRDNTDWHSMNGGGFLFNTIVENDTISGYYVLITKNGLKLYSLDNINLNSFRNSYIAGTLLQTFPFSNVYDEHHITISADNHTLSLWDGEDIVIDNYELSKTFGNGYGPITSHASHGCSQRSYFTFANITMQTITGEKLHNVLDNYNFESQNSRYVINLSDSAIDDLNTEEEINETAQKIINKNITFIGLGNDTNRTQYESLIDLIGDNSIYFNYTDETVENSLQNCIINREEDKRVKTDNQTVATDLVFIGTLNNGTVFTKTFDSLCVGETLSFTIPTELTDLTVGINAIVLDNITLTYKDENGIARTTHTNKLTLPVITPQGKITSCVYTDKSDYSPYQDVVIFDRIHNVFNNRTAKNLVNEITILNSNGVTVSEYKKPLPEIMPNGYIEHREIWNTSSYDSDTYTVYSNVYDGDLLVAQSTSNFTVTVPDVPEVKLIGELSVSGKSFDISDTVMIDSSIKNVGYTDVTNATAVINIIDTKNSITVYHYETPLNLVVSQNISDSIEIVPETNFSQLKGSTYLVTYEVVTSDNRTIPLSSDGFELVGITQTVTLYFVDNTQEKWVHNDNAIMELVDNTFGHNHYEMMKIDDVTWSAEVPATAYNITFNRYNSDKTTQWNSWSAGGRDANNTYYADISEHGHWSYVEYVINENYFHEGDIIYLDLSDFTSWENDNAIMYVNFSDVSKAENGGLDIDIAANAGSNLYQPRAITDTFNGYIYTYIVTKQDEGKDVLRFWRGNESTLWNCSVTLNYDAYKSGNNCIKVNGWNAQGELYSK